MNKTIYATMCNISVVLKMDVSTGATDGYEKFRVRVTFPEFFAQGHHKFEDDPGHFEPPNIVSYTENGHLIRIKIFPDKIRKSLVSHPIVYKVIMELIALPIMGAVKADLMGVDDLLKEIRSKLVTKGMHEMHFYYEKNGNNYKVFEGHNRRDPATGDLYHLFQKVAIIKRLQKESVDPAYREIYKIIQSLNIEQDAETGEVYLSSSSLRTAIEDAILIYMTDDGINSFPVDDTKNQ